MGEGPGVSTTLYRIPLSGNRLLSAQSGHSKHTIRGIPLAQFLRLKRICSDDLQFNKEAVFPDRGYPKWMRNRAYNIAKHKSRDELVTTDVSKKVDPYKNKLTPSSPFSNTFSEVCAIINKYLPILYMDDTCANILQNGINIIPRRGPTLCQYLSPSFYDNKSRTQSFTWLHFKGNFKYGSSGCPCCSHILADNSFRASSNQRE